MTPWLRFRFDVMKAIEGIQLLASEKPGITQYYVGKIFFFADREHLRDWGRPISGDRYVAMEHGPVPSSIRDLLKLSSDEPDEIADKLFAKVEIVQEGNKSRVFSKEKTLDLKYLSGTDVEYLLNALREYGNKSFGYIKAQSHADAAYDNAWGQPGLNNEMDLRLWFSDSQINELLESAPLLRRA
jgi:uncharacterized phage-associated protein